MLCSSSVFEGRFLFDEPIAIGSCGVSIPEVSDDYGCSSLPVEFDNIALCLDQVVDHFADMLEDEVQGCVRKHTLYQWAVEHDKAMIFPDDIAYFYLQVLQ